MTETPGIYDLGKSGSESKRKIIEALNKLERQGVAWAEVLETMSAIASAKGWSSQAAILEDAAKICRQ
jgi:hypothetical protein